MLKLETLSIYPISIDCYPRFAYKIGVKTKKGLSIMSLETISETAAHYAETFYLALGYRPFVRVSGECIIVRNKAGECEYSESDLRLLTDRLSARIYGPCHIWLSEGETVGLGTQKELDLLILDGIYSVGEIQLGDQL